jgi:hypothetical protein
VPLQSHELVKIAKRGVCISYKGMRYRDRPKKRVVLSEIVANHRRESIRHEPFYSYKQCDVYLCKNRWCFKVFY